MASILRLAKLALCMVILVVGTFATLMLPATAETYTVKMGTDTGLLAYEPSTLTVQPGDTVVFVNNKAYPHNVVFDKTPGSAALAKQLSYTKLLTKPGAEISVAFPEDAPTGEYHFYCQPHRGAGMEGEITVE